MMMYRCINYRQCSGSELLLKGFHAKVTPVNNKELGRTFFLKPLQLYPVSKSKTPQKGPEWPSFKEKWRSDALGKYFEFKIMHLEFSISLSFSEKEEQSVTFWKSASHSTLWARQPRDGSKQNKKNSRRPQNCSGTSILRKSHPNHQPTQKFIIAKNLSNLKTESCFF